MYGMSTRKRFGVFSAGIGAGVTGIALFLETLDAAQLIASTVLICLGIWLVVFDHERSE